MELNIDKCVIRTGFVSRQVLQRYDIIDTYMTFLINKIEQTQRELHDITSDYDPLSSVSLHISNLQQILIFTKQSFNKKIAEPAKISRASAHEMIATFT